MTHPAVEAALDLAQRHGMNGHDAITDAEPVAVDVPRLVRLADVIPEPVDWLWYHYCPRRKLTLLEGDPGIGKSYILAALATAVSLGLGLPGVVAFKPGTVLMMSAEDGLGDTIRPRLEGMGADLSRVVAADAPFTLDETGMALLQRWISEVKPDLVTIDPIVAYMGGKVDLHRANEVRAVTAPLVDIIASSNAALIATLHLSKASQNRALYRGLGSIDLPAAARSVLLAGNDPDNPSDRALIQIKSNLAPFGPALGYSIDSAGFRWTGESTLTAGAILAPESADGGGRRDQAADFLRDVLADGPMPSKEIDQERRAAGISEATLNRAKTSLGVRAYRLGEAGRRGGGQWVWELPQEIKAIKSVSKEDLIPLNPPKAESAPDRPQVDPLNRPASARRDPQAEVVEL